MHFGGFSRSGPFSGAASVSVAAQSPPAPVPPAPAPVPAPARIASAGGAAPTLDQLLTQAMDRNPGILAAKAKVAMAKAELKKIRFEVARQLVACWNDIKVQEQVVASARARFTEVEKLMKMNAVAPEEFRAAKDALIEAEAKLAVARSELQFLTGHGPPAVSASQAKQQYKVVFRLQGRPYGPPMEVSDGQRGRLVDVSQTPFVTAVASDTDPKRAVKQPHIVVLEEGTKVTMIVTGRQFGGATVDVTVEASKITGVEERRIGPDTVVQIPAVELYKKRVIDFVKFGEALVVPLADKGPKGTAARLEIVVQPMDKLHVEKPGEASHALDRLPQPGAKELAAAMKLKPPIIIQDDEE